MRKPYLLLIGLMLSAGCATGRPLSFDPPAASTATQSVTAARPTVVDKSPAIIPGADREQVWQATVDVLQNYFEIEDVARGEVSGDNVLTRHRLDRSDSSGQIAPLAMLSPLGPSHQQSGVNEPPLMRRRAFAHLVPVESGILLDLSVFREVEDIDLPEPEFQQLSASEAAENPGWRRDVDPNRPEIGWFPTGRDETLEGSLISEVRSRLDATQPLVAYGEPDYRSPAGNYLRQFPRSLATDYRNFYAPRNLVLFTVGAGVASIFANTSLDWEIAEQYQDQIRTSGTNRSSHAVKQLGEATTMIPIYLLAITAGGLAERYPAAGLISDWGDRTMRSMLVGGPFMLLMQRVTGASRPSEDHSGSRWNFWKDNNGVSGHAFVGAAPWFVAASMTDDPYLKAGFYAGSTIVGWSRVNDNAHYFSQVLLGWWLAYVSTRAVDETETGPRRWLLTPVPVSGGLGLGVEMRH